MGAYKYCRNCDSPMGSATPQQDLIDGHELEDCGSFQGREKSEAEWIVDLSETIKELQIEIEILEDKFEKHRLGCYED